MNKEQCQTCVFWENPECAWNMQPDDREGTCRRFPSIYVRIDEYDPKEAVQSASHWCQPVMFATEWCGEFKARLTVIA